MGSLSKMQTLFESKGDGSTASSLLMVYSIMNIRKLQLKGSCHILQCNEGNTNSIQ